MNGHALPFAIKGKGDITEPEMGKDMETEGGNHGIELELGTWNENKKKICRDTRQRARFGSLHRNGIQLRNTVE